VSETELSEVDRKWVEGLRRLIADIRKLPPPPPKPPKSERKVLKKKAPILLPFRLAKAEGQ
jgi:hypothetical protein